MCGRKMDNVRIQIEQPCDENTKIYDCGECEVDSLVLLMDRVMDREQCNGSCMGGQYRCKRMVQ